MDPKIRMILIRNLLERLDADANLEIPRLNGFISSAEREAIRELLQETNPQEHGAEEPTDIRSEHGIESQQPEDSAPSEIKTVFVHTGTASTSLVLDSLDAKPEDGMVLCLDFGTAKSKAFAGSVEDDDDPDPLMLELGLGKLDSDPDGAVYSVNSSIWISDDGHLFAGSRALRNSSSSQYVGSPRRRLDSIKQELSLTNSEDDLAQRILDKTINPTSEALSYEDALCFFLAYLTDLAGRDLQERHRYSRYMKRRFTLPAWQASQRRWAAGTLTDCLKRAQLLADTFSNRWDEGIPVSEFKAANVAAKRYSSRLDHLIDASMPSAGGLLEPLAAGSSRIWADKSVRNLILVLDVGAGTTDFSLFWVVQDQKNNTRRAFSVHPSSYALRMAGDLVDDILIKTIMEQVYGHPDELTRRRIESGLRLSSVRRLKEQLFTRGTVEVALVTDQVVSLNRAEFQESDAMTKLSREFRSSIESFLGKAHSSWEKALENPMIVLSGGSASLPFISALAEQSWTIAGRTFKFIKAPSVPELISTSFDIDFQREYQQLAVAVGGVLPMLNEKNVLTEWYGGSLPPGTLEGYYIKGN